MFVWKFIIPLTIHIIAFWKILAVIRRQAKVKPTSRRKTTVKPVDASTIPPSNTTAIASVSNLSPRHKVEPRGQRQGENTGVSQTEINVIKTMLFIVVCFTLCYMPKTFDLMYMKLIVSHFSILTQIMS